MTFLAVKQRLEPFAWKKVPAVILESAVAKSGEYGETFCPQLKYRYEWQTHIYEGSQLMVIDQDASYRDEVIARLEPFPVGAKVTCLVNPERPKQAVLAISDDFFVCIWMGIAGLIVSILATGMLISVWAKSESVSERAGFVARVCAGSFFMVPGIAVLFQVALPGLRQGKETLGWMECPAVVTASDLISKSTSDHGRSERAKISYDYEFRGHRYVGGRIEAVSGFTSNDEQQALTNRFPKGLRTVCYVNPERPDVAVLIRGNPGALVNIFGGAIFFVIGFLIAFLPSILRRFASRRVATSA